MGIDNPERKEARRTRFKALLDRHSLDGILILSVEDVRYLSGFDGSDAIMALSEERDFFLTDSRYITQAEEQTKGIRIVPYEKKSKGLIALIQEEGWKRMAYDPRGMTMELYLELKEGLEEVQWVPLREAFASLRARKDPEEISDIEEAIAISTKGIEGVIPRIEKGQRERDIAWELEASFRSQGADAVAFGIIVASGARSAMPHGRASEKRLEKGDLVVIDYGCQYRGYHSDETCTFIVGRPDPKQEEIYRVVREAHDLAIESVRPGMEKREIDRVAREHIAAAGYGDFFGHGTGHGVGLAVHEEPVISPHAHGRVEEGMVFTVEPGIYIPGWGGVRIEDMVLVEANGGRILTRFPKTMRMV